MYQTSFGGQAVNELAQASTQRSPDTPSWIYRI